ncbi:hypothetical protein V1478_011268 [Vespula squamosa]|uniref:Uncharacterized protein n=1 Tax=Vespula squamosa TaxID=30214 RepID=A0ABD2AE05_VESSQ
MNINTYSLESIVAFHYCVCVKCRIIKDPKRASSPRLKIVTIKKSKRGTFIIRPVGGADVITAYAL